MARSGHSHRGVRLGPRGGLCGSGSGHWIGRRQLLAVYAGFPRGSGTVRVMLCGPCVCPGSGKEEEPWNRGSAGGPPGGIPGKGTDPVGPIQPVTLVCAPGGVDWAPPPSSLLGGSVCPFAAPRMAWFLGQPPVLRVLPVPAQTLWVQPPGAALGPVCACARVCVCVCVCVCARVARSQGRGWPLPPMSTVWWSSPVAPPVGILLGEGTGPRATESGPSQPPPCRCLLPMGERHRCPCLTESAHLACLVSGVQTGWAGPASLPCPPSGAA